MGNDPRRSVTDAWCQLHDVPNVFARMARASFPQVAQNPTLTMMAITVRACDHINGSKRNEV